MSPKPGETTPKQEEEAEDDDEEESEDEEKPFRAEEEAKAKKIELRGRALEFWHRDEWENIMNMYTNEGFFDALLCWVRPTRDFLSFLHAELRRLHVTKLVSVGCGCGFLEWLIKRACSGIQVIGYEVDRSWWQGRYGVKPFIEHIYIDEVKTRHIPEDSALLTCYFHSWECWHQYLAEFRGEILIVIGPDTNGNITFPEPRHVLADPRFICESQRKIEGGDKVVIMRRNHDRWPVPPLPQEEALPSVKPPESKTERKNQFNEMRRALVMDRICKAKTQPVAAPPDPSVRQGPALQSTYRTRKPSLSFSLGLCSVAARTQSLEGGRMRRSVSANARLDTVGLQGPGSGGTSTRRSGSGTPSRRRPAPAQLGVDAAFCGRPLRESRSAPLLAPLCETAELADTDWQHHERAESRSPEPGWQRFCPPQQRGRRPSRCQSRDGTDTEENGTGVGRRRRPDHSRDGTDTEENGTGVGRRRRSDHSRDGTDTEENGTGVGRRRRPDHSRDGSDAETTGAESRSRRRHRFFPEPESGQHMERQPYNTLKLEAQRAAALRRERQAVAGGWQLTPPRVTVTDLSRRLRGDS